MAEKRIEQLNDKYCKKGVKLGILRVVLGEPNGWPFLFVLI